MLDGTVSIVTGAARYRGIGRAVALQLAALGAAVVVVGRRGPAPELAHEQELGWNGLSSLVDEIASLGGHAVAVTADVSDVDEVTAMVDTTVERFGRLDIVVNNAGSGRFGPLLVDLELAEWEHVLRVNLTGTFIVSKIAAARMIAFGNGGSITNVSSVAGRVGVAHMGAYSPAKFGVIGLTQAMASELAEHRIRVNCVAPGAIETDLEDSTLRGVGRELGVDEARARAARVRRVPLGRFGTPQEAAAAIIYLASPAASFVTGQTLNVSGGPPFG